MTAADCEQAQCDCLSTLAGIDTTNRNLRDHQEAYIALDKLMDLAYSHGRIDQRTDDAKALEALATQIRIGL
jgi:hypothetical protein